MDFRFKLSLGGFWEEEVMNKEEVTEVFEQGYLQSFNQSDLKDMVLWLKPTSILHIRMFRNWHAMNLQA